MSLEFSRLRAFALTFAALLAILLSTVPPAPRSPASPPAPGHTAALSARSASVVDPWAGRDPELLVPGEAPEQQRTWLRSVSTAPLHPRLAGKHHDDPEPDQPRLAEPHLRVDDLAQDALERAYATPGVRFATRIHLLELPGRTAGGEALERPLTVAFVDPARFRTLTPRLTAASEPAWRAAGSQLLLTHEAGRALGVGPGEELVLGDAGAELRLPVGAWVSLGRAGVADAVTSAEALTRTGRQATTTMLVAAGAEDEAAAVAERLITGGVGTVTPLPRATPYQARLAGSDQGTVDAFEPFAFMPRAGGKIHIDPGWVERNITWARVPILGDVRCHRLLIPQLRAALTEIAEAGLADLLDPSDFGGCYYPRHIGRDHGRNLSMHAWGLSFDVNVQTNLYGHEPQLDERIVEVFERHGFAWGGHWRTPDGMHFELVELRPAP